jgi:hypothetical protein
MNLLFLFTVPCFECKHFIPMPKDNTYEHAKCDKFLKYADIARKDEGKCGASGKYFVSKDEPQKIKD